MPLKPLEVLKKGLKILQDQVKANQEKLQTDEEICQAMLDVKNAQEEGLINGGDVDDDSSSGSFCH